MKLKFSIITLIVFLAGILSISAQDKVLSARKLNRKKVYTSIEEALKNPDKVYRLSLERTSNNDTALTKIPVEIYKFHNLQELNISNNQISEIPKELFKLEKLQILNMSFNPIKSIPIEITQLQHLRILEMKFCLLTKLPVQLSECVNLEELNFYANHIEDIPVEFAKLINLETFIIKKNGLTQEKQNAVKAMLPDTDFSK